MVARPTEQEMMLSEIEKELDRLNALYNQYFMGIERLEPTVQKKNLDRRIRLLRSQRMNNTALSFRLQMQIQRYNTQSNYWTRVCRQIENGTYVRHVMLANRRTKAREEAAGIHIPVDDMGLPQDDLPGEHSIDIDFDIDDFGMALDDPFSMGLDSLSPEPKPANGLMDSLDDPFAEKNARIAVPQKQPKPAPAKESPPKASSAPSNAQKSLSRDQAQAIYKRYVAARKKCNQATDDISFDKVAKSLANKSAKGNLDFKVVIKNGKAAIVTKKKP